MTTLLKIKVKAEKGKAWLRVTPKYISKRLYNGMLPFESSGIKIQGPAHPYTSKTTAIKTPRNIVICLGSFLNPEDTKGALVPCDPSSSQEVTSQLTQAFACLREHALLKLKKRYGAHDKPLANTTEGEQR